MQSDEGTVTHNQAQAQEYRPRVKCPACLSAAVEVTRTMPVEKMDTARVRYHRCRICKTLFKSVEALTTP
jgi:formate dehydrogenase maturation protein FdhE